MKLSDLPTSQLEAIRYFSDDAVCHEFLAAMRWPDGVRCAHCDSENIGKLVVTQVTSRSKKPDAKPTTRRLWNCKACKNQFTVKTRSIFENSALGLDKWLPAVWMICNAKNGVSSCELARSLGITQKSAWFMGHRIRSAMREGNFTLSGEVEADEAFIGGSTRNMHRSKREAMPHPFANKTEVVGALQRSKHKGGSRVLLDAVDSQFANSAHAHVREKVKAGSKLYTDAATHYKSLPRDRYDHEFVDHAIEYARGHVHTNGMENFWSLLKRTLKGTYVRVSRFHLYRYLDEQATRFNERADDDLTRFLSSMQRVHGRRLPYAALTNIGLY